MQALEQYLECHRKLCSMLGYETTLQSFFDDRMDNNDNNDSNDDPNYSHSHDENGRHYEEGELVPAKGGFGPYVYYSPEYIRRSNEEFDKRATYET